MGDLNFNFPYKPVCMYSLSYFYPDVINIVLELQSLEQDNWESIRREIPFLLIFPMAGRLLYPDFYSGSGHAYFFYNSIIAL